MNSSERTTLICRGIYLYARLMNLPVCDMEKSEEETDWLEFKHKYPAEISQFVMIAQYKLFDQVNSHSWRY